MPSEQRVPKPQPERRTFSVEVMDAGGRRGAEMRRPSTATRARRERVICTAERLFAERGIEGCTLRDVRQAVGDEQFGPSWTVADRNDLIRAVYRYRAAALDERRRAWLWRLQAQGRLGDPAALLHALLEPHARHVGDRTSHFLVMLARVQAARGYLAVDGGGGPITTSAYDQIAELLRGCSPPLPAEAFTRRFSLAFAWAIETLAEHHLLTRRSSPAATAAPLDEVVGMLLGALSGSHGSAEVR